MPEDSHSDPSITAGLGRVMALSAEMVTTTLVAGALGWLADRALGSSPLLLVLGILLGGAGGIAAAWRTWTRRMQ